MHEHCHGPIRQPIRNPKCRPGGLPYVFLDATWRGTTRVDRMADLIVVSFDRPGGEVIRLALPTACARNLAETILHYLAVDSHSVTHSPMSSGMPSVAVSTPQ